MVRPHQCVVYISKNPIGYIIQRRREYFLQDQKAREKVQAEWYKKHVNSPPQDHTVAAKTSQASDCWCYPHATFHCRRKPFLGTSWNIGKFKCMERWCTARLSVYRARTFNQSSFICVTLDGGRPRSSMVVTWTPIPIHTLQPWPSQPWCQQGSPSYTSCWN